MRNFMIVMIVLSCLCRNCKQALADDHEEEIQVLTTLYEYQFNHNVSGLQQGAGVYCLSQSFLGGSNSNPPEIVLEKFKSHQPRVKMISDCNNSASGVIDEKTGKRGLIFFVMRITISGNTAKAIGGYYEGGLSSSLNTYLLQKRKGLWEVIEDRLMMIS